MTALILRHVPAATLRDNVNSSVSGGLIVLSLPNSRVALTFYPRDQR